MKSSEKDLYEALCLAADWIELHPSAATVPEAHAEIEFVMDLRTVIANHGGSMFPPRHEQNTGG